MFCINCTWVQLLLPYKDRFWPHCHLPLYLSPHQPVSFFILKFSMTLFSSFLCSNIFIGLLIFWFWIFGFWIFEKTSDCLFMFLLRVRKEQIIIYEWLLFKWEPVNANLSKHLCSRIFCSSTLYYNFKEVLTCSDELWNCSLKWRSFFQILKFEFGSSRFFRIFRLIPKKKKEVT